MKRLKDLLKSKRIVSYFVALCAAVGMSVSVFAGTDNSMESMTTVLTESFGTMITQMMESVAAILPIVLPLFGVSMLVAFAIKWFRQIVTKSS